MIWRQVRLGDGSASPMIDYLLWRRSLNPQRFDFFHPRLGPSLGNHADPPVTVSVPQNLVPTTPTTPPLIPAVPQTIEPNVPEPSTFVIGLLMGVWGVCSRRRLRSAMSSRDH
jgi:hypothetical protein